MERDRTYTESKLEAAAIQQAIREGQEINLDQSLACAFTAQGE